MSAINDNEMNDSLRPVWQTKGRGGVLDYGGSSVVHVETKVLILSLDSRPFQLRALNKFQMRATMQRKIKLEQKKEMMAPGTPRTRNKNRNKNKNYNNNSTQDHKALIAPHKKEGGKGYWYSPYLAEDDLANILDLIVLMQLMDVSRNHLAWCTHTPTITHPYMNKKNQ